MKGYLQNHETERLVMKPLSKDHIEPWKRFLTDSRTNAFFPPEAQRADYSEHWIQRQLFRYETEKYGFLGIHLKTSEILIGQAGILVQNLEGNEVFEIGYHLFPEYWGNGYATEASSYFKNYAFKNNLTDKLYSMIHVDNLPSQKVATRNGMTNERETVIWSLPVYLYTIEKITHESTH